MCNAGWLDVFKVQKSRMNIKCGYKSTFKNLTSDVRIWTFKLLNLRADILYFISSNCLK